jgi:2-oxoglutarate ferredoxin oxidoreductase subunit gamma
MLERLFIAGSGGQGIILIGRILASAAVRTTPHVTFYPAYGAEVRGGTSNCQIVLSSHEIHSAVTELLDTIILMNQASLNKFLPVARVTDHIFLNSSLCRIPRGMAAASIPASEIAAKLGDVCAANFVMLGAYIAKRKTVAAADISLATETSFVSKPRDVTSLNLKAFHTGLTL